MNEDGKLYLLTPEEQKSVTSFDFSSKTSDFLFHFPNASPRNLNGSLLQTVVQSSNHCWLQQV